MNLQYILISLYYNINISINIATFITFSVSPEFMYSCNC